jgi:hypothetical protein
MMLVTNDGESDQSYPVITGWAIPGMDGWEITSVVGEKGAKLNARIAKADRKKEVHIVTTSSGF